MLFYKVEGMLNEIEAECEENHRAQRETARKIQVKTETFNEKCRRGFCFVADRSDGLVTAGVIADRREDADRIMQDYWKHLDFALRDVTVAELTIGGIQQLLNRAERRGFIDDDSEIIEKVGIDKVVGRRGRGIEFGENIIENSTRKEISEASAKYLMEEAMEPELQRIYAGASAVNIQGHPVHYMILTDRAETRREGCKLLLQALYANGRIRSKRYCFLNFRPGEGFSQLAFDSLYNVCNGGAVLIRYLANEEAEDADIASSERDTIERICETVKHYRNQVLTLICLPREGKNAKEIFRENLGALTFVELQESLAVGDRACAFLKRLAKEQHVRTDKALFAKLEEGKGYSVPELHELFDTWYNSKLKTAVYPQYKDFAAVGRKVIKAAPKGSAYDDLQEMIGLTEAKAVIRKALNYYKMQKLYEQKGIKKDTPAMHMVFTGNPGTAKTTAARLFASIMKDNGLLSKGQLVEVGRGDLVGKYVGWTAQTVQAKFRAAKGGVLFIDEAYSLVDDRSGSYGDEAINTIVQEMENHREDVVVIFAGYPDEMEKFLKKNPGLHSRIAFHVPFEDYNAEELCKIAELMGKRKGMCFDEGAMEKLGSAFEAARKQSGFGNGRYVRNLLEQAKMNQASRLLEYDFDDITTEEIKTIKAVDIVVPEVKAEAKRTIGFAC